MNDSKLANLEEKFCMVYACGPSPYRGNARMTYALVFNGRTGTSYETDEEQRVEEDIEDALAVHDLMLRDDIKNRIEEINSEVIVNASTLRPRLTETLLKISDECSTLTVTDRFGNTMSPAALRAVSVNAISKLMEIYGVKEDIAHKVMLEGTDGDGITFNLIMPEQNRENELAGIIE